MPNHESWTWIVAALPGIGDIGMQVPAGVITSPKLPDEFRARKLTAFIRIPEEQGVQIQLHPLMLHQIGAMGDECRIRSAAVALWAAATEDAAGKLTARWSPVAVPTPMEQSAVLKVLRDR